MLLVDLPFMCVGKFLCEEREYCNRNNSVSEKRFKNGNANSHHSTML